MSRTKTLVHGKLENALIDLREENARLAWELREAMGRIGDLEILTSTLLITLAQANPPMAEKIKGDPKWSKYLESMGFTINPGTMTETHHGG